MKRILIIDDNADAVELLAMLLEFHGHAVGCAASGQAGLDLAATFNPDMVITDLGLPDMCGVDVIRSLAQARGTGTFAIVALTGRSDVETRRRAEWAGADHFFAKGDDLGDLLGVVERPCV